MTGSQLAGTRGRILRMLHLLQTHKAMTCPQLAAELGVSTRTVERYLRDLRRAGYSIKGIPGGGIEYEGRNGP